PDRLGRAVLTLQFGERVLELLKAAQHPVVLCVIDEHLVALVVRVAQLKDARRQVVSFGLRGLEVGGLRHTDSLRAPADDQQVPFAASASAENTASSAPRPTTSSLPTTAALSSTSTDGSRSAMQMAQIGRAACRERWWSEG